MTPKQCARCGRHSYKNGKCYADRQTGRDVREYIWCYWAFHKH
jgi:hypothetical protein